MLYKTRLKPILAIQFLFLSICIILHTEAKAQQETATGTKTYFGIGLELARTTPPLSPKWKFGLGGSFLFEARFSKSLAATASLSYVKFEEHWGGRYNGSHIDQIALLLGGRYYFAKHFFASGQLGYNVYQDNYDDVGGSVMVVPGFGFRYGKLDITAKYATAHRDYRDLSYFGLRIGVAF